MKKLFHKLTTILVICFMCVGIFPNMAFAATSTDTIRITGTYNYDKAYEVLDQVNQEREEAGLSDLTMDQELMDAAMQRAAECSVYFSHTRPSGSSWSGISSKASGENIAAGQSTAAQVMNSWMNSQGHKDNILRSSFQSIGIGCFVQNGVTYWVQDFGTGQASSAAKESNREETVSITIDPSLFSDSLSLTVSESEIDAGNSTSVSVRFRNPEISTYTTLPADQFVWNSSSSAATVDSSGIVTGLDGGSAVITATTPAGGLSASTTVTVNAVEVEPDPSETGDPTQEDEITEEPAQEDEVTEEPAQEDEITEEPAQEDEVTEEPAQINETTEDDSECGSVSPHFEMNPDSVVLTEGETYTLDPEMYWYNEDYPDGLTEDFTFIQEALSYSEGYLVTMDKEKVDISDVTSDISELLPMEFNEDGTLNLSAGNLDEEYAYASITLHIMTSGNTDWNESDPDGVWEWTTWFEVEIDSDEAGAAATVISGNRTSVNTGDINYTDDHSYVDDRDDVDINVALTNVDDDHSENITILADHLRRNRGECDDPTQVNGIVSTAHPKTGDTSLMIIYILIIGGAAACIAGVLVYRRRKSQVE